MREDLQKLRIFIWIVRRVLWFFFIFFYLWFASACLLQGDANLRWVFGSFGRFFLTIRSCRDAFYIFILQNQTSKQFMFLQVEETVLKFSFPFFLLLEHEFSISYTILFWLLTFCSMKNIAKCTLKYVSSSDSLCLSR